MFFPKTRLQAAQIFLNLRGTVKIIIVAQPGLRMMLTPLCMLQEY